MEERQSSRPEAAERKNDTAKQALSHLKKLVDERKKALEDDAITAEERESLERKAKEIRDFLEAGKTPEDRYERECAMMEAVQETAELMPDVNARDVYGWIFGETAYEDANLVLSSFVLDAASEEEVKKSPPILTHAVLKEWDIERMLYCFKKYRNEPYAKDILLSNANKGRTATLFANYDQWKDHPASEEVIRAVGRNYPAQLLHSYKLYKDKPYAEKVMEEAAQRCVENDPQVTVLNYENYQDHPQAKRILEAAARNEADRSPGNFVYFAFKYISDEAYALELMMAIAQKNPWAILNNADWMISMDWLHAEEVLNAAIQTGPQYGMRLNFNAYGGKPYMKSIVLKLLDDETNAFIFFRHLPDYKILPFFKEALRKAAYKSPYKIFSDPQGYKEYGDNAFQEDLLEQAARGSAESDGSYFLAYAEQLKQKPYFNALLEQSVKNARPADILYHTDLFLDKPYAKAVLMEACEEYPEGILINFNRLKGLPYAKEMLKAAAFGNIKRNAKSINSYSSLSYYPLFENEPYAKEVLEKAARENLDDALSCYRFYKNEPYAKEVLEKAARAAAKQKGRFWRMESAIPYFKDEPYADEIIEQTAMGDMESALMYFDAIKGRSFAGDILRQAAQEIPDSIFLRVHTIKDHPAAKEAFLTAAEHAPRRAIDSYDDYHDLPYAKEILQAGIKKEPAYAIQGMNSVFKLKRLKGKDYYAEIVEMAVRKTAVQSPESVLEYFDFYGKQPYAAEVVKQAVTELGRRGDDIVLHHFDLYKNEPYAEEVVRELAKNNGQEVLKKFRVIREQPYAEAVIAIAARDAAERFPEFAIEILDNWQYQDIHARKNRNAAMELEMIDRARKLMSWHEQLHRVEGVERRGLFLSELMDGINKKIKPQLKSFNEKNHLSIELAGIRKEPYEFVFVNTWKNPEDKQKWPVRLALTYSEMQSDNVEEIFQKKLESEAAKLKDQYDIWRAAGFDFDIPKNGKTVFTIVTVPDILEGIESDFALIAELYKERYGAHWQSALMEKPWDWKKAVKDNKKLQDTPVNIEPTKEHILSALEGNLKKAIDERRELFIFDYIMHGSDDGSMNAQNAHIEAKEFAEILAKDYKGQPLSAQIEVMMVAESCYGGSQIEAIINYLQEHNTPVKGLRIISDASKKTSASAGINTSNASLISDKMRGDKAGAKNYYLTYYYEWIDSFKKQGIEIKPPMGTFSHALAFVDRMAREDSVTVVGAEQDLQAYYYSTMKGPQKLEMNKPVPPAKKSINAPETTPPLKETKKGKYFSGRNSKNRERAA